MTHSAFKDLVEKYQNNEDRVIYRLYSYEECHAFKDFKEEGFEITSKISDRFKIPFKSIFYVGSAQFGYSYFRGKKFEPGVSDLDVAIIDTQLFAKYLEIANIHTKNFTNRSAYPSHGVLNPTEVSKQFEAYLLKGYMRPDFMPICPHKREWDEFFDKLSSSYLHLFKKITCGIYISQSLFNMKQRAIIQKIKDHK